MDQGRDGTHREFELKAKADVEHHQPQRQQHGQSALLSQLITHLRTDKLGPAQLDTVAGRTAQDLQHVAAVGVQIGRKADQDIAICAEADHLGSRIASRFQRTANGIEISGITVLDLHQRAAGKVQPPLQLVHHQ